MILRRVTEHVRAQNWLAVGIDFVIVVVGVFIGLQVANWNSERLDRIEAGNVLERLEQEFQMHLERTDLSLVRHEASLAAAARLINGVRDRRLVEESLTRDVGLVTGFSTPTGPSTTFQELVSSGRLRLVRGNDLRRELLQYNDYVSLVRSQYGVFTQPLVESRRILLRARSLTVSGRPSEEIDLSWSTEAVDSASLMSDPELMVTLQMAYGTQDNIHAVLLGIRQRILRILELIESQQGGAP